MAASTTLCISTACIWQIFAKEIHSITVDSERATLQQGRLERLDEDTYSGKTTLREYLTFLHGKMKKKSKPPSQRELLREGSNIIGWPGQIKGIGHLSPGT